VAADAAATSEAVAELLPFDLLIVDHYGLDQRWERALRPKAKRCIVIDDLADRPHDCDLLVDVTPGEERTARYDALIPPNALTLLGPRYALLRPEFSSLRTAMRPRAGRIQRILVSLGAIDADNLSEAALRAIRQSCGTGTDIDIVLGANAPHRSTLAHAIRSDRRARLHVETPDLATLMAAADLAIGAGGTTSWERACLGLPAIVTSVADNQRDNIEALRRAGAALPLPSGDGYEARLSQALAALASEPQRLTAMSEAAARLVDGRGAERIAAILLRPIVTMRAATAADCQSVWRWRNEPDIRLASTLSDPIPWDKHRAWFDSTLAGSGRRLLIGEADGGAVGVVSFDLAGERATVSAYLTPAGRGRGIGPELLLQGQAWLQHYRPDVTRIEAVIRPENEPSIAAFTAARYRPKGEYYVRELPHDAR